MSALIAPLVPTDQNISVYALPLYWSLCVLPHAVAIAIGSQYQPLTRWDNRNPRSGDMKMKLRKRLGDALYAKYERAEASHYNSLESFPLIAAVVAFANLAKLPIVDLNSYVVGMGILRVIHTILYIQTSTQMPTVARTLVWYYQIGWSLKLFWDAAGTLA